MGVLEMLLQQLGGNQGGARPMPQPPGMPQDMPPMQPMPAPPGMPQNPQPRPEPPRQPGMNDMMQLLAAGAGGMGRDAPVDVPGYWGGKGHQLPEPELPPGWQPPEIVDPDIERRQKMQDAVRRYQQKMPKVEPPRDVITPQPLWNTSKGRMA
jgi:hypothetical protein